MIALLSGALCGSILIVGPRGKQGLHAVMPNVNDSMTISPRVSFQLRSRLCVTCQLCGCTLDGFLFCLLLLDFFGLRILCSPFFFDIVLLLGIANEERISLASLVVGCKQLR